MSNATIYCRSNGRMCSVAMQDYTDLEEAKLVAKEHLTSQGISYDEPVLALLQGAKSV